MCLNFQVGIKMRRRIYEIKVFFAFSVSDLTLPKPEKVVINFMGHYYVITHLLNYR